MPANNLDRKLILRELNKCIKLAYSGVTATEHDALIVVRNYIKMFYEKDLNAEKRKDK